MQQETVERERLANDAIEEKLNAILTTGRNENTKRSSCPSDSGFLGGSV